MKHFFRRLTFAIAGIVTALRTDKSYRQQVYGIASIIAFFIFYFHPLDQVEILFLGLAYTLILITELQNSSFETALDKLHPEHHTDIGKSKDMAAGAVLTAGLFLVFVLTVIALY